MTRQDRVEILAQAMWLGMFGVTAVRQDWLDYATNNAAAATDLRNRASNMLDVAEAAGPLNSLGWISQAGADPADALKQAQFQASVVQQAQGV
jgi:hypothetical protein